MPRKGSTSQIPSTEDSPMSSRSTLSRKRKRSTTDIDSGAESFDDAGDEDGGGDRRRMPGVKRACNECRQQKLRCDVVQDPFSECSRCRRLRLECKIESSFKRVGKRSRNAEMERELIELRRQLGTSVQNSPESSHPPPLRVPSVPVETPCVQQVPRRHDHYRGSEDVITSLLDLKQGLNGGGYVEHLNGPAPGTRIIENVAVSPGQIVSLFARYFTYYHPLLPLLDPTKTPDYYYNSSPLLFWTILSTASRRYEPEPTLLDALAPAVSRLIWSTLREIPQSYHVVKALCLLCTWPSPISTTSADPTFMLSGVMMHVAMQIGLHRPSYAQDFARFQVQLRDEDLRDRVRTWAACNIVSQCVGTGYGQRPSSLYDWTLEHGPSKDASYRLPDELRNRVQIEKFCDKVTRSLYSNRNDPVGLTKDDERYSLCNLLVRDFEELEAQLGQEISVIDILHLRAAELHLRLSTFFDSPTSESYHHDLFKLYSATTAFLSHLLSLETSEGGLMIHATNYILQMTVAGGFTLHKLLNSFFAKHVNLGEGIAIFHRTIRAIRKISVKDNDLPARLAEVLAQLWRAAGAGVARGRNNTPHSTNTTERDASLMLKVRCRMSMSLVFDSVWRWREEFQRDGRGNLDSAVKNPTDPASSSTPAPADPSNGSHLVAQIPYTSSSALHNSSSGSTPGLMNGVVGMSLPTTSPHNPSTPSQALLLQTHPPNNNSTTATNITHDSHHQNNGGTMLDPMINYLDYEVFDPLNWMLDGFVDFPHGELNGGDGFSSPPPLPPPPVSVAGAGVGQIPPVLSSGILPPPPVPLSTSTAVSTPAIPSAPLSGKEGSSIPVLATARSAI